MSDIDKLEGVELRKAVAEAVGWEWRTLNNYGDGLSGIIYPVPCAVDTDLRTRFAGRITFDDAIAACEAAGYYELTLVRVRNGSTTIKVDAIAEYTCMASASGTTPESLCRSLLKALEAKHGD